MIKQGAPVKNRQPFGKKNRFWAKKRQRNDFFGISHITALKHSAILLCCSDSAQTYRIVAHFIVEGGKTKFKTQNSSQFLFATSQISRVSRK